MFSSLGRFTLFFNMKEGVTWCVIQFLAIVLFLWGVIIHLELDHIAPSLSLLHLRLSVCSGMVTVHVCVRFREIRPHLGLLHHMPPWFVLKIIFACNLLGLFSLVYCFASLVLLSAFSVRDNLSVTLSNDAIFLAFFWLCSMLPLGSGLLTFTLL